MTADSLSWFNVKAFGARGDGKALDSPAIQAAIEACDRAGGGTVYVPAGSYVVGSIFLHSHMTLHLDAGATLLGSESPSDYPVVPSRWEGVERETYAALITARHASQIALTGRGTVDGRGSCWWTKHRNKTLEYPRPRLVSFSDCQNVHIEGVTLVNSPSWTVHPVRCENITIQGLTILNPHDSPNTDGINPDSCRYVHIANCHIDVGDDCIAIKSGIETEPPERRTPCENITITNCTMVRGHGGVVVGSETSGGVRNVAIANCIFNGTDRGIRIKSRRGRGGVVEDIRVSNILMQDVLCPFTINLYYHVGVKGNPSIADKAPLPIDEGTPQVRRIHYSHITARNAHTAAAYLYGLPERPIEDVSFDDVSISMADQAPASPPEMADGVEPMERAGFFARFIRGLRLNAVRVENQIGEAFLLSDITDT